jgi:hypothetical protein
MPFLISNSVKKEAGQGFVLKKWKNQKVPQSKKQSLTQIQS